MTWNAALVLKYNMPIPGREGKAMEVFAKAFTVFGKLAADGICTEPKVFHHLVGGGMMIVKAETIEKVHELLGVDEVREVIDAAIFTVNDFEIELMITGDQLMSNVANYTKIGTELGYI